MKSRIAIFEGYGTPFGRSSMGRSSLGRRSYIVPAREGSVVPPRKAYRVKAKRDTPAMKRAAKKFKTCARKCAKKKRGARKNFPSCMRRCITKGRSKRRTSSRR